MDIDFMAAPILDEFGNVEYDNSIGEYIATGIDEQEEEPQFYDAHEVNAELEEETWEDECAPPYYADDWGTQGEGGDYSLSMIRCGAGEPSDQPNRITKIELEEESTESERANDFLIAAGRTETHDPRSADGLLFDSGAAINICPKHYAAEVPMRPVPENCNLRIANGQALPTYGMRTVGYELSDRRRKYISTWIA